MPPGVCDRRPIGLIGGMSYASTALYYETLNRLAQDRLGGLHSAEILLWSVDFAPIAQWQAEGDWDRAAGRLAAVAQRLEAAGAGVLVLATNTMHKVADAITDAVSIPLLHIADATGEAVRAAGLSRPAVLATRFTMEEPFYVERLRDRHGLHPTVPDADDRALVHAVIYDELCKGRVREASRSAFEAVALRLARTGADCVILGCTEVGLLLSEHNVPVPVFDTTRIHCERAVAAWLGGEARRSDVAA